MLKEGSTKPEPGTSLRSDSIWPSALVLGSVSKGFAEESLPVSVEAAAGGGEAELEGSGGVAGDGSAASGGGTAAGAESSSGLSSGRRMTPPGGIFSRLYRHPGA